MSKDKNLPDKAQPTELAVTEESQQEGFVRKLEKFNKLLSKKPHHTKVKKNQQADYLPIQYVRTKLSELFVGLWKTEYKDGQLTTNSYVIHLELSVFHPILKQWMTYYGVGAAPIQVSKETKQLLANSTQKAVGAAKAYALKNAAKDIGAVFGGDLNKADLEDYEPIYSNMYDKQKAPKPDDQD